MPSIYYFNHLILLFYDTKGNYNCYRNDFSSNIYIYIYIIQLLSNTFSIYVLKTSIFDIYIYIYIYQIYTHMK